MGCIQSKKDTGDFHPNVYRVVNIDENGTDLWSGQLEVTEVDLVLYRDGREPTVWPLRCLRRYGYDGEIFSFESGRRCNTGEGIYAFRCRRAGMLFRRLQQNIQIRNIVQESMPFQIPASLLPPTPGSHSRNTLQGRMVHRSSLDVERERNNSILSSSTPHHVPLPPLDTVPTSPSSVDILEVMPLNAHPQGIQNHVTNVYQMQDTRGREHNNNQSNATQHAYSNDFNRDLAKLRTTLKQEAALNTIKDLEDETHFLQTKYMNANFHMNQNPPLSPTISNSSEPYARLSMEEATRPYMNLPSEGFQDMNRNDFIPNTPLTPKNLDFPNLNFKPKKDENISYANLAIGEMDTSKLGKHCTGAGKKCSESDTYMSMSPVEELEVNYAELDIDSKRRDVASPESHSVSSSKNESTASQGSSLVASKLVSQGSVEKSGFTSSGPVGIGYTTIDFDKTGALTSVASGEVEIEAEGCRKTRHNSTSFSCNSPTLLENIRKDFVKNY